MKKKRRHVYCPACSLPKPIGENPCLACGYYARLDVNNCPACSLPKPIGENPCLACGYYARLDVNNPLPYPFTRVLKTKYPFG